AGVPGLLEQLASGPLERTLTRFDDAGRQLERHALDAVSILPNQDQSAGFVDTAHAGPGRNFEHVKFVDGRAVPSHDPILAKLEPRPLHQVVAFEHLPRSDLSHAGSVPRSERWVKHGKAPARSRPPRGRDRKSVEEG